MKRLLEGTFFGGPWDNRRALLGANMRETLTFSVRGFKGYYTNKTPEGFYMTYNGAHAVSGYKWFWHNA